MIEQVHSTSVSGPLVAGSSFACAMQPELTIKGHARMSLTWVNSREHRSSETGTGRRPDRPARAVAAGAITLRRSCVKQIVQEKLVANLPGSRVACAMTLCALVTSCSVDDRTVSTAPAAGGDSGTGGDGSGRGGGDSGASGGTAGLSSAGASSGSPAGGSGAVTADAGMTPPPARNCGGSGEACCEDSPRCDSGLGCNLASVTCSPCAAFQGVGILAGFMRSQVQAISADGRFVVGSSENDTGETQAFRSEWATTQGPVALGVLAGGTSSSAIAVSRDGFAVVGTSESSAGERGFRWTGTMLDLGTWQVGDLSSRAADVSADGNVVLLTSDGMDGSQLAFLWQLGGGKAPIIGMEEARGLSADGQRSVGNRASGEAVYAAPGVAALGTLAGDAVAFARGISSDGSVAVGVSGSCGCRGFSWQNGVMQEAVGLFRALATNEDGSVVVGDSVDTSCSGGKAAIWTPALGKRAVACDLLPTGLIPSGWALSLVTAVSDDGRVIAGEGTNPSLAAEGWVAVLGPDCRQPEQR